MACAFRLLRQPSRPNTGFRTTAALLSYIAVILRKNGASGWNSSPRAAFRRYSNTVDTQMLRILFSAGIAGLVFAGGSGTTQAAPILPLPAAATAAIDNMTDVQWGRSCWRDRWGRLRCNRGWGPGWGPGWGRNCWRDRWGRLRCRY